MINEKRLIDLFMKSVQIDSETKNEREYADFLKEKLISLGLEVTEDNAGESINGNAGNVIGKLKAKGVEGTLAFSAHMDTVTPGNGIIPKIDGDRIISESDTILAADDKSGICAIIEALETIVENDMDRPNIEVFFTIAEEGGLFGAKYLDMSKYDAKMMFVFDSGGDVGTVINQAPGQDKIIGEIIGVPAHAGIEPEKGISAIQIFANAVSQMNLYRIDEETTANIGVVEAGTATNIVTPKLTFKAEARSLNMDKLAKQSEHMVKTFEKVANDMGGKADIKVERMYNPYKVNDDDEVMLLAKKAFEKLNIKTIVKPTGGGSDANIHASKGIQTLNLGTGMSKVHTLDEFITIENLTNIAKVTLQIMKG